jgi:hypothetical protein
MADAGKVKRWARDQWEQIRGNAKWSLVVTIANIVLALLGRVTLGPHWQMWAFITIASVYFLLCISFPTLWSRQWTRIILILPAGVVLICCIVKISQLTAPSMPPSSNLANSVVAQITNSTNAWLKNNSGNTTYSFGSVGGGNNQFGAGNLQVNNLGPQPTILTQRIVSLNAKSNGLFKTRFEMDVQYPNDKMYVLSTCPHGTGVAQTEDAGDVMFIDGIDGHMNTPVLRCYFDIYTTNPVNDSTFHLSLTNVP